MAKNKSRNAVRRMYRALDRLACRWAREDTFIRIAGPNVKRVSTALAYARRVCSDSDWAAVERAHAELVQALHATIRAAEPAGGVR